MQERPDSKTLAPLTSVRLFAASGILFFHAWPPFFGASLLPTWPLGQSISLFFVLSGFILYYVYPTLHTKRAAARFLIARIARLWPVHMLCIVLVFALLYPGSNASFTPVSYLVADVLLIHGWVPVWQLNFFLNGVSWTLSTEMGFYVLFPLLVHNFARTWWWKLPGSFALAMAILAFVHLGGFEMQPEEHVVSAVSLGYVFPLTRLFEFVVGMTAGLFWQRIAQRYAPAPWLATLLEIAAIALVVTSMALSLSLTGWANRTLAPAYGQWVFRAGPSCIAFGAMLVVFAMRRGLISAILSWRPLVVLGQVSFAVYMTHQILLRVLLRHYPSPNTWSIPPWISLIAFVAVTVALSYVIFRWFETPLRQIIVKRYDRGLSLR